MRVPDKMEMYKMMTQKCLTMDSHEQQVTEQHQATIHFLWLCTTEL